MVGAGPRHGRRQSTRALGKGRPSKAVLVACTVDCPPEVKLQGSLTQCSSRITARSQELRQVGTLPCRSLRPAR